MSLNELAATINEINVANGWKIATPETWEDERHLPALLCLVHSEISEALEGFRHGDRENVAEELADALIRILDIAGGLGIDMDREVHAKLEVNRHRGYKHGGKVI